MDINKLQEVARTGDRAAEEELFGILLARFRLFARLRIRATADAEEVVQDALKVIFEKYRSTEFETSFTAWAYQVMKNRLLTHVTTAGRRDKRQTDIDAMPQEPSVNQPDKDLERRLLFCLEKVNRAHSRHARILNLHYQGYAQADICDAARPDPNQFLHDSVAGTRRA